MSRDVLLVDGPKAGQTAQVADDASELVIPFPSRILYFPPIGSTLKPTDQDVLKRVYYRPSGTFAGHQEIWTCQGEQP